MTPLPLDQLRLQWRAHLSALWWLGLLYRRPTLFHQVAVLLSWTQGLRTVFWLWLHFLTYFVCFCLVGRFVALLVLRFPVLPALETPWDVVHFDATPIAQALTVSLAVGMTFGTAKRMAIGIALGVAAEIVWGIFMISTG